VLLVSRRDLWKAPEEDGGVLVDPPLERAEELLEVNRRRLDGAKVTLSGYSLEQIRKNSRFMANCHNPVVASGHQPELFHPGVWIKKFVQVELAKRHGLCSLFVTVDTDLVKKTSVTFPVIDSDPYRVRTLEVRFDSAVTGTTYLSDSPHDPELSGRFLKTAQGIWAEWNFTPLLARFWVRAAKHFEESYHGQLETGESARLGWHDCFSLTRREIELEWGCPWYEKSLSSVSWKPVFNFHVQLLSDLPRFHAAYNGCLQEYRKKYRSRSKTHPVPDLVVYGDYLEAPFWWIDLKSGRRRRLFTRCRGDCLDLTPDPSTPPVTVRRGIVQDIWALMEQQSMGIFTRALTTTMFLRLCVADLFIHGIGGAKYDELTDDIIRRYFGIEPPEYMVVSGTLRLPFEDKLFPRLGCSNPRRKARDVLWNPERYLEADDPRALQLVAEKQQWIEREPADSAGRQERFYQLHTLTMRLREYVAEEQKEAEADLQRCEAEAAANRILTNRDYAFVLYPEETLRPFLTQFLK
jgi:hypothetical protein